MDDLMAQKQQQANLVQAWESARQASETTSQGRAIMMFTVVTIIFVSCKTYCQFCGSAS